MLAAAIERAPRAPGIYCFLGADEELLYVGKAADIAARLRQHVRPGSGAAGVRGALLYERVRAVRFAVFADEPAAAAFEADVIVALRPRFNASHRDDGRWTYVVVAPIAREPDRLRFTLSTVIEAAPARAYGCFPHLGKGVSSPPGRACRDGYPALLRLLWLASAPVGASTPARITRGAPDRFEVAVAEALRAPLHAFLSGTRDAITGTLVQQAVARRSELGAAASERVLARDRALANDFFEHGPQALRRLRLRRGAAAAPLARAAIERFVSAELADAIGPFARPAPRTAEDDALGRRAHPWARGSGESGR